VIILVFFIEIGGLTNHLTSLFIAYAVEKMQYLNKQPLIIFKAFF